MRKAATPTSSAAIVPRHDFGIRTPTDASNARDAAVVANRKRHGAAGRIDVAIVRAGDQVGASTAGLVAAILFEPVAAGTGTLSVSGTGTLAGGGVAALQFAPAGVVVR